MKNKSLRICRLQFKLLSLAFVLLGLGVLSCGTAKAAPSWASTTPVIYTPATISTTTTEFGSFLCFLHKQGMNYCSDTAFYLDGIVNNQYHHFQTLYSNFSGCTQTEGVYLFQDVPIGSHTITWNGDDNRMTATCFFDKDITSFATSTTPITISYATTTASTTLSNLSNKVVYSYINYDGTGGMSQPDISYYPAQQTFQTSIAGGYPSYKVFINSFNPPANSINLQFSLLRSNINYDWATYTNWIFNKAPSEYCGDSLCQTATENCSSCPVDCGECADNPNAGDSSSLFFFFNPYTFSNQSTAKINYLYNENVFTTYDYIEIRKIDSDWINSTFLATSTIIDASGFYADKSNGNSYFTLTGNASTTGIVEYEVIGHLAAYWSPTLGDVSATTTIPYVVAVNWQETQMPTAADILAASSSNPFYDDTAMYYAACDEDQWNTPNPEFIGISMAALNLTVVGCQFKLGFIIAGNKFTTIATDGIYKAGNILKNVFPFNVYTNLNAAWQASENATVISELSFLSPVDGNLTAQIPTTGTSTATIVLWGKDVFTSSSTLGVSNAQKTNQMFLAIKTIIKWALWGLFGLWAIKNGKAFVDKMTEGE